MALKKAKAKANAQAVREGKKLWKKAATAKSTQPQSLNEESAKEKKEKRNKRKALLKKRKQ